MPTVLVKENEPSEVALRRFKRACEKAAIIPEIRRREFHEKPTEARKRRAAAAVKRHWKRRLRDNPILARLYARTHPKKETATNKRPGFRNTSDRQ